MQQRECYYIADNEAFINIILQDFLGLFNRDKFFYPLDVTYALNVFFSPGIVIKSNCQWRTDNNFGVVNIFGNGAKIVASSGDRDEYKWIETACD